MNYYLLADGYMNGSSCSNIETPRQFLDAIEQSITFSDRCVEQLGFFIRSVRLDDARDLINLAIKPAVVDEVGQLAIDEVAGDAERARHVVDGHRLERFEVLLVGHEPHFLRVVLGVVLHEPVLRDHVTDFNVSLEESFVIAIVEALAELLQVRNLAIHRQHVGRVDDVLLDRLSVLRQQPEHDSVEDEVLEVDELDRSEGRDRGDEEVGGLLEISRQNAVYAFVDLQLVLLVPVGAIFHELVAGFDVLLDLDEIFFLDVHEEYLEEDLHFLRGASGHVVRLSEDLDGINKVLALEGQELCLVERDVPDFDLTLILLGICNLIFKLLELRFDLTFAPLLCRFPRLLLLSKKSDVHLFLYFIIIWLRK